MATFLFYQGKKILKSRKLLGLLFLSILILSQGKAQPETGLFSQDEILDLELEMDIRTVIRDVGEERIYHPANISYLNSEGEKISFQVKVQARGNMRRNPDVCTFPPLWLNFKKKGTEGSIFEGQNKIKLVTHCKKMKSYQQSLFKEYLIYQHYNLLTDKSNRVRMGRITYIDSEARNEPLEQYIILLEHIKQVASRNRSKPTKIKLRHQDVCEKSNLDLMVMFQFMIGHTDWSVSEKHNIKLIQNDTDNRFSPIPYDFDYSGVINAPYAAPDPNLPISNVKSRLFRGYCRPPGGYEQVIEVFNQKKEEIYDLYQDFELLDPKESATITKYFDKFYDIVNDPKKIKTQINRACLLNHPHAYKLKLAIPQSEG